LKVLQCLMVNGLCFSELDGCQRKSSQDDFWTAESIF
jgi:hypothetical protein